MSEMVIRIYQKELHGSQEAAMILKIMNLLHTVVMIIGKTIDNEISYMIGR